MKLDTSQMLYRCCYCGEPIASKEAVDEINKNGYHNDVSGLEKDFTGLMIYTCGICRVRQLWPDKENNKAKWVEEDIELDWKKEK